MSVSPQTPCSAVTPLTHTVTSTPKAKFTRNKHFPQKQTFRGGYVF